jgi:isopentenyl-diphosphate Delta-isomerase
MMVLMAELWQLYDDQGQALPGQGATKDDIFKGGLLHGAAQVWIWRKQADTTEVLLQKRAPAKRTWPNLLDISAAGHVDLGEEPVQAARRETEEELGLKVDTSELQLLGVERQHMTTPDGDIENEICWVYGLELARHEIFKLEDAEVESLIWKGLDEFELETINDSEGRQYVPHGRSYYEKVIKGIEKMAA